MKERPVGQLKFQVLSFKFETLEFGFALAHFRAMNMNVWLAVIVAGLSACGFGQSKPKPVN